jgi:hypothetical protein
VPEPSAFAVKLAIEKLNSHKSPGIDQIPAELIKTGAGRFALRSINLLFLFGISRNYLRSGSIRQLYLNIRREIKQIVSITRTYHSYQVLTNVIQHPDVKVNSTCRGNYWGSSMWISTQ